MASYSQIVRTENGLASDILQITNVLTAAGAPSSDLGVNGNTYVDNVSGIQYQKKSGVWEPTVDYSSFSTPIPDPLTRNQINVNTIQGNATEDVNFNVGNGLVQIVGTGGSVASLQIGQVGSLDGVKIENNGNIKAGSLVQGFRLESYNGGTKIIEVESNTGEIRSFNSPELKILNQTSNIQLSLEPSLATVKNPVSNKSIALNVATSTISTNADNSLILQNLTTGEDVEIKAEQVGAGNVRLNPGAGGEVQITKNLNVQNNNIVNVGNITHSAASEMLIENTAAADNLRIRASSLGGSGSVIINAGNLGGQIVHNNPATFSPFGLTTSSINNSDTITQYRNLAVDSTGNLFFAKSNMAINFMWSQIGANGTTYGTLGHGTFGPSDVPSVYIPYAFNINMVSAVLHYSGPWSWGGGTAVIEIVRIPTNQATITANAIVIATLPLITGSDFYQVSLGSNTNITVASTTKLGARLVATGTASTSNTAELTATIYVN